MTQPHEERHDRPRVLLVEDNAEDRRLLRELLEMDGIEVVGEAPNGRLGVELATELAPDVVLMDVRMPEVGGIDATRMVKKASPLTQVVVLTADDHMLAIDARKAGAYAFLDKGRAPQMIKEVVVQAHRLKLRLEGRLPRS